MKKSELSRCALILMLFTLLTSVASADPLSYLILSKQPHRQFGGPPTKVVAGTVAQKTDHFNVAETRTFSQRYWITTTYTKGTNSPILLYLCGESACGSGALTYGPLLKIANETGATILSLEHRYYGKSQPFSDLSNANLKFLSTEQAIEDVREFRNLMRAQKSLTGPWILVGGSYAGNLAAYTKRTYPNEFLGAIASSAPVRPEVDFKAYDQYVATLAGSECVASLQSTLSEIEAKSKTQSGYEEIQALFKSSSVTRRDDFLYLLSDISSAAIQLGYKAEFCAALKSEGVEGFRKMKSLVEAKIADFSVYTAEQAENVSLQKHGTGFGLRQWFYQSCTEYGYWQNAWPDVRQSARSREINAAYHNLLCQRLYRLPGAGTATAISQKYYEPLMSVLTTNTLFTRGTLDPWASLAMKTTDQSVFGKGTVVHEIASGGHCEDLGIGGPPAVQNAKALMSTLVRRWLAEQ